MTTTAQDGSITYLTAHIATQECLNNRQLIATRGW